MDKNLCSADLAGMAKDKRCKKGVSSCHQASESDLKPKGNMKRINNLYEQIYATENLRLADAIARRGKAKQHGVLVHDKNREANIIDLQQALINKTFKTAPYQTRTIYEPKEREIFILPYYPDRILQHAIMNILEPIFVATFTRDTYSCIKGKGILDASMSLRRSLKDVTGTSYCLKLDITKFYPSVKHDILIAMLRRKFKDQDLLALLEEIIESAPGLPIGNYLSQYFANFYLSRFDHWLKEIKGVKHYFRYADDLVILSDNKKHLHQLLSEIRFYLDAYLKLEVKGNYQVFPVAARGIDFVGYVHYHTHVLLRKTIKKRFAKMLARRKNRASIASYRGWSKHCNSKNLIKTLLHDNDDKIIPGPRSKIKEPDRRQDRDTAGA